MRLIKQSNPRPLTQMHAESPGACLAAGGMEEGTEQPYGIKWTQVWGLPTTSGHTRLSSCWHSCFHSRSICFSLWVASLSPKVRSLLSLFAWWRIIQATPGFNLAYREGRIVVEGWKATECRSPGLRGEKGSMEDEWLDERAGGATTGVGTEACSR